jgi:hypothetical protein
MTLDRVVRDTVSGGPRLRKQRRQPGLLTGIGTIFDENCRNVDFAFAQELEASGGLQVAVMTAVVRVPCRFVGRRYNQVFGRRFSYVASGRNCATAMQEPMPRTTRELGLDSPVQRLNRTAAFRSPLL